MSYPGPSHRQDLTQASEYMQPSHGRFGPGQFQSPTSASRGNTTFSNMSDSKDFGSDDDDGLLSPAPQPGSAPGSAKSKDRRPHATRRRVVQSCSECRRRKIKCDKKFPCGPCILRSDQERCHEVGLADKTISITTHTYATANELDTINNRLDSLEQSLLKSGAIHPSDLNGYITSVPQPITGPVADEPSSSALPPTDSGTEEAALTLEHLAFGRRHDTDGISLFAVAHPSRPEMGYSYSRSRPEPVSTGFPLEQPNEGKASLLGLEKMPPKSKWTEMSEEERLRRTDELLELLGPTDIVDVFFRKTDIVLKLLAKTLPTHQIGEILVKAYLEKVDWLHRCIHVPTFMKICHEIWSMPRERVVREIGLNCIGLYHTVCLLGLLFMDTSEVSKYFTAEEVRTLPDTWYNTIRSTMWGADFMAEHTLESIQCVLLLVVFMKNRDRSDAAWAMLGSIIKMAQGLGLSRLGSEPEIMDSKDQFWTGQWTSLIQREVGRRIWWNLVFLDWALAPAYNFACCISPDQIKTAPPANIEDNDLSDDKPLRPQPPHVWTRMSFQIAKLKFAEIGHRQIWAANQAMHSPYSFVLSVDGELRKALMELPPFYQPDQIHREPAPGNSDDQVQFYERTMLSLACHSRVLRLHRPWLSRGYKDERFAYSKEQCLRAARASLRMMGDHNQSASFLEKWWLPLFYTSVSGLVVIMDLLRTPRRDMQSAETEAKIQEVKGALNQMRRIAHVSQPSRAALKFMDLLMLEVEERRKPGSNLGKRKHENPQLGKGNDENSCLQRAVKKLIVEAQLEADSSPRSQTASSPTSGWSPSGPKSSRELDMRIFSDTPRDRPVFDAYPLPNPNAAESTDAPPPVSREAINRDLAKPSIPHSGFTPFLFPHSQAPSVMPDFQPQITPVSQPQLNPAVETILASYFPQQQDAVSSQNGQGQMPSQMAHPAAPDHFLSQVFNFGWDNAAGANIPNGQMPPNGQAENGQDAQGVAPGYETWSMHGWMA